MPPRLFHTSDVRAFAAVAFCLAGLIALGGAAQAWWMSRLPGQLEFVQAAQAEAAFDETAALVQQVYADLKADARALAAAPAIRSSLRRLADDGPETLVRMVTALEPEAYSMVEVYGGVPPALVAWQGSGSAPAALLDSSALQQAVFVQEGGNRSILVVRHAVHDGAEVVGSVQTRRVLRYTPPVQNAFLRPYALTAGVEARTGIGVRLLPVGSTARTIYATDGTALVSVEIVPPPPETLLRAERRRFIDLKAFWATLLGGWLLWGLWRVYRRNGTGVGPGKARRAGATFALWALALGGMRAGLLALDVPGRWQVRPAPLAPLFDPTHLASTYGFGVLRSIGDVVVTAAFVLAFALALFNLLERLAIFTPRARAPVAQPRTGAVVLGAVVAAVQGLLVAFLAGVGQRSVLDSTLDLFDRSGLIPTTLVLLVLCALLTLVLGVLLVGVSVWGAGLHVLEKLTGRLAWRDLLPVAAGVALLGGAIYLMLGAEKTGVWATTLLFVTGSAALALARRSRWHLSWGELTLRRVLAGVLGLTALLYPLLYQGMDAQRRARMADAAETFDESRDPRALFGLSQALDAAAADAELATLLQMPADSLYRAARDVAAARLVRTTLMGALDGYDVTLLFFDSQGRITGRYTEASDLAGQAVQEARDSDDFALLRAMHSERGGDEAIIEPITGEREADRFQYIGVKPLAGGAWVLARAEPQVVSQDLATPFPRVLLPSSYSNALNRDLAIALFRDGVLVRGVGRDFGRYRLDDEVQRRLRSQPVLWRTEQGRSEPFTTRYERQAQGFAPEPGRPPSGTQRVVAVRIAALSLFDHLFFLLRLTLSGLLLGFPLWMLGLVMRRRAGLLPPPRQRFQDRVLNAFLGVGILSVMAVGLVGLRVVTGENERAVASWLRQHLERVEETLALDAQPGELPYQVLQRTPVDSLARRVGLDLNVYRAGELVASSRPALVRDGLIDARLPGEAYRSLVFDGYRFTTTEASVGRFRYTAGFRALPDEMGQPRYVLSVPTLPEQERIEEEQARMVAYLFGALLLLLLIVLATALVLARALARPIGRLREGLRNLARGTFQSTIPVTSRDEIGELVETFNEMQGQLAESRRRLAQQERQLAWREMARQVAHEIKNPLTPMKLSIQHLRRAFDDLGAGEDVRGGRFGKLFDRVTITLIEQTDALARIAGDFSSFARLPRRISEPLDLNEIVEEAARLMQEEEGAEIVLHLHPQPLVLHADREELRRIYINLMKNAIQAMSERDEKRVRVSTALSADSLEALSAVEDRGTGIPEALQSRIFEPNFSTKTSGTGLGLAIVLKAVEEMGGRIFFETEEGIGTTFHLALPLAEGDATERPEDA